MTDPEEEWQQCQPCNEGPTEPWWQEEDDPWAAEPVAPVAKVKKELSEAQKAAIARRREEAVSRKKRKKLLKKGGYIQEILENLITIII